MIADLRAIMVCVDFADLLAVTLPRNRHHFKEIHVITSSADGETKRLCMWEDGKRGPRITVWATDLFHADGAAFAKWRALEWGFDQMGRHGWIANMDADVIWPKSIEWPQEMAPGFLCSPLRRMLSLPELIPGECSFVSTEDSIRPHLEMEMLWKNLSIHRNVNEWAGYSQIFHADDPVLGPPPWHQTDWKHAGGADSFFQAKWPREKRIRPNWECLHIGAAGENWFGRTSQRLDGSVPEGREEKLRATAEMWQRRTERRRQGLDQFEPERIKPNDSSQSL